MMRVLMIMLITISFSSFGIESQCVGSFTVHFDSHKVEYRNEETISAWIPGVVQVQGDLKQCGRILALIPVESSQIQLKGNGQNLDGQLLDEGFKALPTASGGKYLLHLNKSGTTKFWLRLPTAGYSAVGKYTARLKAKFVNHNVDFVYFADVGYDSIPVVSMVVPSISEPWLSKSGNNYRVDMGEMTWGATRDITLSMRSNSTVLVSIESQNGSLKHETMTNQKIDYKLRLQGETWSPRAPFNKVMNSVHANRYTNIPFSILVDPQPRAYAGNYSDRLTITISAR